MSMNYILCISLIMCALLWPGYTAYAQVTIPEETAYRCAKYGTSLDAIKANPDLLYTCDRANDTFGRCEACDTLLFDQTRDIWCLSNYGADMVLLENSSSTSPCDTLDKPDFTRACQGTVPCLYTIKCASSQRQTPFGVSFTDPDCTRTNNVSNFCYATIQPEFDGLTSDYSNDNDLGENLCEQNEASARIRPEGLGYRYRSQGCVAYKLDTTTSTGGTPVALDSSTTIDYTQCVNAPNYDIAYSSIVKPNCCQCRIGYAGQGSDNNKDEPFSNCKGCAAYATIVFTSYNDELKRLIQNKDILEAYCASDSDCSGHTTCNVQTGQCISSTVTPSICADDSECLSGEICNNGTCEPSSTTPTTCTTNDECSTGQICNTVSGECEDDDSTIPTTCNQDDDCSSGEICNNGMCESSTTPTICTDDTQCATGQKCNTTTGVCQTDDVTSCTTNTDCPTGQTCVNNECEATSASSECTADTDCAEGETCVDGKCEAATTPECTADTDCAEGETCVDSKCETSATTPECTADTDCAAGQTCVDSKCETTATTACTADTDCATGQTCVDSKCETSTTTPECSADSECAAGQICVDSKCESEPEPFAIQADDDDDTKVATFPPIRSGEARYRQFRLGMVSMLSQVLQYPVERILIEPSFVGFAKDVTVTDALREEMDAITDLKTHIPTAEQMQRFFDPSRLRSQDYHPTGDDIILIVTFTGDCANTSKDTLSDIYDLFNDLREDDIPRGIPDTSNNSLNTDDNTTEQPLSAAKRLSQLLSTGNIMSTTASATGIIIPPSSSSSNNDNTMNTQDDSTVQSSSLFLSSSIMRQYQVDTVQVNEMFAPTCNGYHACPYGLSPFNIAIDSASKSTYDETLVMILIVSFIVLVILLSFIYCIFFTQKKFSDSEYTPLIVQNHTKSD